MYTAAIPGVSLQRSLTVKRLSTLVLLASLLAGCNMPLSVATARRGGATAEDVVNARPLREILR